MMLIPFLAVGCDGVYADLWRINLAPLGYRSNVRTSIDLRLL